MTKYFVFFCILTCSTTLLSILRKVRNVKVISVYISMNGCSLKIYILFDLPQLMYFTLTRQSSGRFSTPHVIYDIKCSLTLVKIYARIQAFKKHNKWRPSVVLPRKWKKNDIDDVAIDLREICAIQRNNRVTRTHITLHSYTAVGISWMCRPAKSSAVGGPAQLRRPRVHSLEQSAISTTWQQPVTEHVTHLFGQSWTPPGAVVALYSAILAPDINVTII